MSYQKRKSALAQRFRGFLPVVVDVETSGLNPATDAILEIAAVIIHMDDSGKLFRGETVAYHVEPFVGANIDPEALKITGIDPTHPFRFAVSEKHALHHIFTQIKQAVEAAGCERAVLVGHNAWFDLAFVLAAAKRSGLQMNPFHSFTTLDTATLSAVVLGETVLAKALRAVGIPFDVRLAHSAIYDAEKTAELFCYITNSLTLTRF